VSTIGERDTAGYGGIESPWVFDADGHVVEPAEMWDRYLPARFRSYAPRVLQHEGYFYFVCGDRVGFRIAGRAESVAAPGQTPHRAEVPLPAAGATDPVARLRDMDTDVIGVAALYPTFGLMIQGVTERDPALALCRAVNDWVADYCRQGGERLVGVGALPMTDADDALAEAKRCVETLGFRGVWRRPEQFSGIPALQDESYEPLWAYLADAGVPLAFHPGVSGLVPYDYLEDRYGDYFGAIHAVHFVAEQMMALTSVIAYGILERHARLRVAFLECGAAWAVPYLHRLDEHLETFGFDRGGLNMKPSEYFARQCFVSAEEVEPGLDAMAASFPGSVVFASDYPHGDGTFPGSTSELLETELLPSDTVDRILADNARRLYGLETAGIGHG
jgi:predicted TIM-barrel fold metal-dependent hydrolase